MNQEQILSILYEMAMVMGAETRVEPLLNKTLQKLLYHTGFPCGVFITKVQTADCNESNPVEHVNAYIDTVIGNHGFHERIGTSLSVPSDFVSGKAGLIEDVARIQILCEETEKYHYLLKLPVASKGAFLLFSVNPPRNDLPFTQLFEPLLNNFAKTLQLCQVNESYTARLVQEREHAYSDLRRFRAALDTSDDCVFLIDPIAMRFVDFNQCALKALGYSREQLLSLGPHQVMADFSLPHWRRIANKALNDNKE
ncbi:PAS domain-containing protein, partial [Kaarinaea lacus]